MVQVSQNQPLKHFSTFGIGGPAQFFTEVNTSEEMAEALKFAKQNSLSTFILGKGSNCLFDDQGFDGLVILNKISFCNYAEPNLVHVGSGYSFSLLGSQTARKGLSGLEFASGIPGSVGGAVYMNAGADGQETCNSVERIDFINDEGEITQIKREDLAFSYRWSSFQEMKGAVAAALFRLSTSENSRQAQLKMIEYRKKTQPLKDMSAGCVFRNPKGHSAGQLIEKCGLKGTVVGGAKVSPIHGNFIINFAEATSKDVLELIQRIQEGVKEKVGVDLTCEIKYIPYSI